VRVFAGEFGFRVSVVSPGSPHPDPLPEGKGGFSDSLLPVQYTEIRIRTRSGASRPRFSDNGFKGARIRTGSVVFPRVWVPEAPGLKARLCYERLSLLRRVRPYPSSGLGARHPASIGCPWFCDSEIPNRRVVLQLSLSGTAFRLPIYRQEYRCPVVWTASPYLPKSVAPKAHVQTEANPNQRARGFGNRGVWNGQGIGNDLLCHLWTPLERGSDLAGRRVISRR